jgi:hypothetical protein
VLLLYECRKVGLAGRLFVGVENNLLLAKLNQAADFCLVRQVLMILTGVLMMNDVRNDQVRADLAPPKLDFTDPSGAAMVLDFLELLPNEGIRFGAQGPKANASSEILEPPLSFPLKWTIPNHVITQNAGLLVQLSYWFTDPLSGDSLESPRVGIILVTFAV